MDHVEVKSEMIKSVGYQEEDSVLEIAFHRGGLYQYLDVPETLFKEFLKCDSKGKFFGKSIKDKFKMQKVG